MLGEVVLVLLLVGIGLTGFIFIRRMRASTKRTEQFHPTTQDEASTSIAQQCARIEEASHALFGSEYLAASVVAAWQRAYPDVIHRASDRAWVRGAPPELAKHIVELCAPFRDLAAAVAMYNTHFLATRMQEEAEAFDRVERFPLTERQRQAIVTDEDTTLVLAGAGTGKTSTIVGKVDYLLRRRLATPDEILVLAYGKKAAEELQTHRLVSLRSRIGGRGEGVDTVFFERTAEDTLYTLVAKLRAEPINQVHNKIPVMMATRKSRGHQLPFVPSN